MATETKHPGDNLIARIKKSATQLEDLQVQLALGKAEAADAYEDAKKKFRTHLQGAKRKLLDTEAGIENSVLSSFGELEVQLALGKAETVEQFNEQKKNILKLVNRINKILHGKPTGNPTDEKFRHDLETFRLKLELLEVHYDLGKMDARDTLEEKKHELQSVLAKLKVRYGLQKEETRSDFEKWDDELQKAYKSLKKIFVGK